MGRETTIADTADLTAFFGAPPLEIAHSDHQEFFENEEFEVRRGSHRLLFGISRNFQDVLILLHGSEGDAPLYEGVFVGITGLRAFESVLEIVAAENWSIQIRLDPTIQIRQKRL